MKFCKDCAYVVRGKYGDPTGCDHLNNVHRDMVTGEIVRSKTMIQLRMERAHGSCGPDAKWFVQREPVEDQRTEGLLRQLISGFLGIKR